jgi:hypothetical protein
LNLLGKSKGGKQIQERFKAAGSIANRRLFCLRIVFFREWPSGEIGKGYTDGGEEL